MPANQLLVERVDACLEETPDVEQKAMMGGIIFMVGGHLACGVHDNTLLVRVDRSDYDQLVEQVGVGPMVMAKRALRTFIQVQPSRLAGTELSTWVRHGVKTVSAMPPKPKRG